MKENLLHIINQYPNETEKLGILMNYLKYHNDSEIIDWNNFDGHIVAGGFIYAKKEKKFLVLYHKDLQIFLYPGGHTDQNDVSPLATALREVKEETGLKNLNLLQVNNNKLVPMDIDVHIIDYNKTLSLPEHYHFDFRYLFTIDKITNVNVDKKEMLNYKWIGIDELKQDSNYGSIVAKMIPLLELE